MKNEKIKEFLTKLAQEESFKAEFLKLKEKLEKQGFSKKDNEKFISECLLPWSKKLGYKLTKKDFFDFDRTQKPTEITELSPAELENVSGGAFPMLFALFAMFGSALAGGIGGGDSTNKNQKKGQDSFSTSLTQYQQADGGETTLAMLRDGHRIGDIILDAYAQQEDVLPDSSAGLLDWDGYHQGAADGANADASSPQAQPAPASEVFSPIIPSAWQDVPEQSGTAEGTGTTRPTAPKGPTGIASYDNYRIGEGELPSNGGHTPVDLEVAQNDSVGPDQPGAEVSADLNPSGLNQNMFLPSGTPVITMQETGSDEQAPGLVTSIAAKFSKGVARAGDSVHNFVEGYMNNYGKTSVEEYNRLYGKTSKKDYDQNYARTSTGDYDQNYARSSPRPSVFPQPRLAGNVGAGASVDASSPISLGAPEGLDISATSSALGGQETINMLKDIHAAENANFKVFETQANQNDSHIGTALVSTSEQASGSLANPVSAEELFSNSSFTGPVSGVTAGGIRWHLNTKGETVFDRDISFSQQATTTGGSTTGSITSTLPTSAASLAGSAPIGLLGYEQSSGGSGAATGAGATSASSDVPSDWTTDQDYLSSAQRFEGTENTSEADFNNPFAGREPIYTQPGLDSPASGAGTGATTPTAQNGPTGVASYDNYLVGEGAIPSGTGSTPVDFGISTVAGNAGGDGGQSVLSQAPQTPNSTPANAPSYQPGTGLDAGGHPYSSAQKINPKGTASTNSSQSGQSWKDFAKATAGSVGIAAGLGAVALGTVYTAGSVASALSGDGAQQNASKTKEATAKAEDNKSTKETKEEESELMRLFMENLQKDSPEAFQYLESLKNE